MPPVAAVVWSAWAAPAAPRPVPFAVVVVAPPPVPGVADAVVAGAAVVGAAVVGAALAFGDDDASDPLTDDALASLELDAAAVVFCVVPPRSPGCTIASATPITMSKSAATPTAAVIREFRGLSSSSVSERATGIEPASSDWKPEALPLSYARMVPARVVARPVRRPCLPTEHWRTRTPGQPRPLRWCYHP